MLLHEKEGCKEIANSRDKKVGSVELQEWMKQEPVGI
jgi:hypothetical protein